MTPRPRRFTLVELLVVIAIVAVLAGILLPTIGTAIKRARASKAKSEMSSLITAMKAYDGEYDIMPFGYGTDGTVSDADYDTIIGILSKTGADKDEGNPRNIRFLNVPKAGEFLDPWGERYVIVADRDANETLDKGLAQGLDDDGDDLPVSVIIYSKGPDRSSNATASNKVNRDKIGRAHV